jgi:hypothetical protein
LGGRQRRRRAGVEWMDFTFLFLSSTTLSGLLSLPRRGLSAAAGGGFGLLFAPALPLPAALSFFFSPLPPATFLSLSSPTRRCGRPVGGWGLRIGSDLSDECLVWFYSKSKSSPSSATADKCCKSTEQNVLKSQIPNGSVRVEIREY